MAKKINEGINRLLDSVLRKIYRLQSFLKHFLTSSKEEINTHLASEFALAKDWNTSEENEAWKNL